MLPLRNVKFCKRALSGFGELHTSADIVIAGGGMVGSAMAAAAAKNGALRNKKILLLEGAPEKNIVIKEDYSNRVSALNATTTDLMERLGAWKLMTNSRVNPVKKMIIWEACSDAKISFANDDHSLLNNLVENDVTEKALTEVMKECHDNLTVMYGSKVKSYKLPNVSETSNVPKEPVTITLDSGEVIETELLIGADGFNSLVRRSMGCQYMGWEYHQMGIVATLELAQPCDNHTAWQRFLPTGPIAILPLSSTHSSLVWSADTSLAKQLMSLGEDDFVDRLNHGLHDHSKKNPLVDNITAAFGQLLSTVSPRENFPNPPVLKSAKFRAAFPFGFGHSTRYCGPRCVLIGDAAHRVHPLAGQGVNLGFGDVDKLVQVLEASVMDGAGLGHHDYLRDYETCRQQHNVPTMLGIDSLQKMYNTSFPPVVLARSLGLQATNAIQPLKKLFAAHAAG